MPIPCHRPSRVLAVAIVLVFVSGHAPLPAQGVWTQVSSGGPSPRRGHGMAFDSQRGRIVLFGGWNSSRLGDTWEWDGSTWTQVATTGPAPRSTVLAYDPQRGRTVLFGGGGYGDTWEWDGTVWLQVANTGPSPRGAHAMANDTLRGRTVLFGGSSGYDETWEWDGTTWMLVATSGPPGRESHKMAYDSLRGRTVLFGGWPNAGNDTWEWDGSTWTLASNTGPARRLAHGMAYDSQRGRTVLFGGYTWGPGAFFDDTWEWDGATWTQVAGTGPAPREMHAMAYDSQRARTLLFGGSDSGSNILGDTWEYSTDASFTSYGTGCPSSLYATSTCAQRNASGGTLTGMTAPLEIAVAGPSGSSFVESFEVFTRSTGGTQVVAAHAYPSFGTTPLASTTMTVGPTSGFYAATFPTPVPTTGGIFLAVDLSAQTVVVPNLTSGTYGSVFARTPPAGSWALAPTITAPSYRVTCRDYAVPALDHLGHPVLGTTYDVTLGDAPPQAGAISLAGLSDTLFQGLTLPYPLPNAPGCSVLAAPDATRFLLTSPTGTATQPIPVPNSVSCIGVELFHQWAVLDAANPLGLVVSNAGKAWVGL